MFSPRSRRPHYYVCERWNNDTSCSSWKCPVYLSISRWHYNLRILSETQHHVPDTCNEGVHMQFHDVQLSDQYKTGQNGSVGWSGI